MRTERVAVYAAIDTERDYQDRLPPDRASGRPRSVGDELVLLKVYVDQAMERWTHCPGDQEALDSVRKVAGIAVRCMEEHGVTPRPSRSSFPPVATR